MKVYVIVLLIAIILSSCLKQSIPDAMLGVKNSGGQGKVTATLSYKINGNAVNISVDDADNQNGFYTLACSLNSGYYILSGVSNSGETTFSFYTDSLAVGNYKFLGTYGDMFFTDYNNTAEYVHAPSDSMSFNITSNNNRHISGNFSGVLTPLLDPNNNIYGDPSSVLITNGSFKNVPVFY
ncbi:MAG TPA: hypothetical protein VIJ75_15420 [Hanamia sp.]